MTLPRSAALVDGTLELQVGDTRFSYPVSLSALAWHVVPTPDGGGRLSWGGPVVNAPGAPRLNVTVRQVLALP